MGLSDLGVSLGASISLGVGDGTEATTETAAVEAGGGGCGGGSGGGGGGGDDGGGLALGCSVIAATGGLV
ncbi:hypothetical protein IF1G_04061 [Cordyceps javanica]|uniref:Uncharacterized protein n=1 Tax=Cordyceps javanica TaxID=43265 RepID=A0A545V539_9HYPO|nr:hypothetical protein IF1G_04061 [Cordyceps javanica]